jgi:hypothetical protein
MPRKGKHIMANDSYSFFGGSSGAPYFAFREVGTSIAGVICDDPVERDATDPGTGEVQTYKDGNPKKVLVVTLQTNLNEGPEDDGKRSVWISTVGQKRAVGDAIRESGRKGLDVGGKLTLTFTGFGEKTNPALNPMKVFSATYQPPNVSETFFEKDVAPQGDPLADLSPEARAALANLARKG